MTHKHIRTWLSGGLVLLLLAMLLPVLAQDEDELPDLVVVEDTGLYPEGVEYDAEGGRFLITSVTRVTEVFDDGNFDVFIDDDDIISAIGIHIDTDNGRILVAASDPGVGEGTTEDTLNATAMLGIYDLETGERLQLVDAGSLLEGDHFANDVTVDDEGNAYLTDSFSPVIYRVDMDGNAEVFLQDDAFAGEGFGFNGIDYHPDGYLLAVTLNAGQIVKIPIDSPEDYTLVELEEPLLGADGINLTEDGDLVVNVGTFAGEGPPMIALVSSDDDWETATVTSSVVTETNVTTTALRDGAVYALFSHLELLFGGDPSQETFEIARIDFGEMDE
jgi:sugar lactone lactonase YvrE